MHRFALGIDCIEAFEQEGCKGSIGVWRFGKPPSEWVSERSAIRQV